MNLVDALVIVTLIGGVLRGLEEGLVHQLFSTIGFFVGLFLGAMLEPHVVGLVHSPLSRLIVTIATVLGCAFALLFVGEIVGIIVKRHLQPQQILNRADNALGSVLAGIGILVLFWLGGSVVTALPYPTLQSEVKKSFIISQLTRHMPTPPDIIAGIGHLIAPKGFPNVFIGNEPAPTPVTLPTPTALAVAIKNDRASVVKIEGQGCGGIVAGSGFVVSSDMVATNAHVIAGIATPEVIDANGTHPATPIWFDPDLDFAILRVSHLAGRPLHFNTESAKRGTPAGVLGYPGGGAFEADAAAILDEFTAIGRNIYNQGRTARDVYSIQATVVPGNSGGPLVKTHGDVIGVIFATSTTYKNVGYALSLERVVGQVAQARNSPHRVSTGSCAE